jgi:hypothetical protein
MTRDELLVIARKRDPKACWVTEEADENCMLVDPSAVRSLLDADPSAYEDPNDPPTPWTRVVFPTMPTLEELEG